MCVMPNQPQGVVFVYIVLQHTDCPQILPTMIHCLELGEDMVRHGAKIIVAQLKRAYWALGFSLYWYFTTLA